jgi:hypothetical protein
VGAGFSTVTPPAQSATSVAQVVWSYSPRSLTDIQSLVSAIQNNNPSLLSTLSDLPFIPAPMYAGQVSATQVASFISNLVKNYNMAGVVAGFINSNPYSLWQPNFMANLVQNPYLGFTNASQILSLTSTSVLASIAINANVSVTALLALISNSALAATAAQGLLYGLANNYYYNKWVQTVTYNAPTSVTFSTNTVLSTNVLIAQNITIASGVTVTCGTTTCFFIAQVFNNQGTITATGAPGGSGGIGGGGTGGVGGGGVVIIASTAAIGSIKVNGGIGGTPYVSATSYTAGSPGVGGVFAVINGVTVPSGGGGPGAAGSGEPNGGGGGVGYAGAGAGAAGGAATVYSFDNGNALITYAVQGISDWWLTNVVGKAPSSVTPLLFVYGSGGGGGGGSSSSSYYGGAGGGGGGGGVVVFGNEVTAGTVSAVGGTGGYNPDDSGAGGGGGGGIVLVFYGPGGLNGTMSLSLAGGGTGVSATAGIDGYAGASGTAYIAQVTVNG